MKKEEENKVNFKRICEETSLHGAKFIFFKKSWVVASFWILVILTMIALAGIIIRVYVVGNKCFLKLQYVHVNYNVYLGFNFSRIF